MIRKELGRYSYQMGKNASVDPSFSLGSESRSNGYLGSVFVLVIGPLVVCIVLYVS